MTVWSRVVRLKKTRVIGRKETRVIGLKETRRVPQYRLILHL